MKKNLSYFNEFMFRHETGAWFMKPVCDFFQLNYDNQVEKINKDKICQTDTGKFLFEQLFGDKRPRLTLQDRGFARWVQMTNPSIIGVELREKFEIFQANIFDYLWKGNIAKTTQLEDIRMYALNINGAIQIKQQIMEYVGEQKNHRDLCLATSPEQWVKVRPTLTETKTLPKGTENLKAIGPRLPDDIDELKKLKKHVQTNITKHRHSLLYQSKVIQDEENPMPEGYKREIKKLHIVRMKSNIAQINSKIIELQGESTKQTEG